MNKSISKRLRLRNGVEFNVTFIRRSFRLIVIQAENRNDMRVKMLTDGRMAGYWSAQVNNTGFTAYHRNPAKAFDTAARHSWRIAAH